MYKTRFDIRQELAQRGANKQQLNTSTVAMMEDIIAENNGEVPTGATGKADRLIAALEGAERNVRNLNSSFEDHLEEARDLVTKLNAASENAKTLVLDKDDDIEAVKVFSAVLEVVKEKVPEEALTENVWICGIQSASFAAWRSIMGPKDLNDKRRG